MKRYQVYLNPHSVGVLDDFEKISSIGRSKLIRELVDRFTQNLVKIFVSRKISPPKKYLFDQLIGIIKLKTKKKTNFAQTVDEIYFKD